MQVSTSPTTSIRNSNPNHDDHQTKTTTTPYYYFPRSQTITQAHSGLPDDNENLNQQQDRDSTPFMIKITDPSEISPSIWCFRILIFIIYLIIGIFGNASYDFPNLNYSMGFAALLSFITIFICIAIESLIIVPCYYGKDSTIGMPCVHWFSYHVTIDSVYHFLHPPNYTDLRKEFAGKKLDVYVEQIPEYHLEETNKDMKDYWFDFVADVGDGFNGTYSVFSTMAQRTLNIQGNILPRANSVIIGGDLVYPWPKKEYLAARFIRPVSWAFPQEHEQEQENERDHVIIKPSLYIILGNHEYANSPLINETILQRKNRQIGSWNLKNNQPYFVIRMPFNWVLFCVDPGNDSIQDLDEDQIQYFKTYVETQTNKEDRFIMVVHEPDWIKNGPLGHGYNLFKKLCYFRKDILGDRLIVSLAGDLHYYRRHEEIISEDNPNSVSIKLQDVPYPSYETNRRQLLVAGHGGAFGHPTFMPDINTIRLGDPHIHNAPEYRKITDYPDPTTSRNIFLENFLHAYSWGKNYGEGIILGLFYMQFFLAITPSDYSKSTTLVNNNNNNGAITSFLQPLWNISLLQRSITSFFFWMTLVHFIVQNIIITTSSMAMNPLFHKFRAIVLIILHTGMHLVFAIVLRMIFDSIWGSILINNSASHVVTDNDRFWYTVLFCYLSNCSMYAAGYWTSCFIESLFMFLAIMVFKAQYNEPMGGIEWQDHKGFLRIRLRADGDMEIFNLGIDKCPRKWVQRDVKSSSSSSFVDNPNVFMPASGNPVEVRIIEKILVKRVVV
jgi:hypothetical protein